MKVRLVTKDCTRDTILTQTVYQVSYDMQIMRSNEMRSAMSDAILRTVYEPVLFQTMSARQTLSESLRDDMK